MERVLWVRHFEDIEDVAQALQEFRDRCDEHCLAEQLQFQSPRQGRERPLALGAVARR
jgi:hypothetical protein